MAEKRENKLFKVASQLNIGKDEIVDFLKTKGFSVENKPTSQLSDEMLDAVYEKFSKEAKLVEKQREKIEKHKTVARKTDAAVSLRSREQERVMEQEARDAADRQERERIERERKEREQKEREARQALERERLEREQAKIDAAAALAQAEKLAEQASDQASEQASALPADQTAAEPVAAAPSTPATEVPAAAVTADATAVTEDGAADDDGTGDGTEEIGEDGIKKKRKRKNNVVITTEPGSRPQLRGLTVLGKVDLQPQRTFKPESRNRDKGPRGADTPITTPISEIRIGAFAGGGNRGGFKRPDAKKAAPLTKKEAEREKKKKRSIKEQVAGVDIDRAIRETLSGNEEASQARMRSKIKQKKKDIREEREQKRQEELQRESGILRVTEFLTTAELANFMGVSPAEIITKCFSLGLMVSINQRLDKETIQLIADDYGYSVEFITEKEIDVEAEIDDDPSTLESRPPIVTIMGHVDHGKTSLLDYIRSANVVAGEAGGITQHIGAYKVELPNGRAIAFLDTPGHEAFTAMRARGAQVTDIVILVVAADDNVMPQTLEAISHAQAANVPMIVAINKIDKENANPDNIRQQLANNNVLLEEWGGKYQSAEISARKGINIDKLLEKVVLEADMLDLKANPNRPARGAVIEAHVDKGRGNVSTIMIQKGTLHVGDAFLTGQFFGRVRAMFDERGHRVESAGPSTPVQVTGFDGLPEAGDVLISSENDAALRDVAIQRQILRREQQLRQVRHITLDDISARIQQGGVKELRLIIKTDVSGSLEALTDSLLKLSRDEVKVQVIYRGVGTITESDVMLAAASDAIVIGFQVTVPTSVRKIIENEQVDVRLYSIIYDAINEIKLALEGMLSPDIKEEVTGRVEVRQVFKISHVGQVAGSYVLNGTIVRNDKIRLLRNGFEIFKGTIQSLKHVKEDVKEMRAGFECGITINGFNEYEPGDIIEAYKILEIKRKLS
jgi:translation initiation factor IF-2